MNFPVFILAAGRGTRLRPLTDSCPKPMLPLLNKPIIVHSIERLVEAGLNEIYIVIGSKDTIISNTINKLFPKLNIKYIIQEKALGTADAVLQVKKKVEPEQFMVIAGDSLFPVKTLVEMKEKHMKEGNTITLSLERMDFELMRYSSTVDYRDGRVWQIREKPETIHEVLSEYNSAALYVFSKQIFNEIEKIEPSKRNEYELASAINEVIKKNKRVGGVITERVCHISTLYDLWYQNLLFLKRKGKRNNYIGENVLFSKRSAVDNCVIGSFSEISGNIALKNCVIMPKTHINRNYINSLISNNFYKTFDENNSIEPVS
ncbi:MAG: sugar phosphate nucleotidyltransferase [Candidatus Hodarchaeales archaeon]